MQIWTIQLSAWRLAKQADVEIVNITAKSGEKCFAPQFQFVMEYKQGVISEVTYTERYLTRMRESFRHNPREWEKLKGKGKVAYACYCQPNKFCHRHLFVSMLTKYFDAENVTYELMGELTRESLPTA